MKIAPSKLLYSNFSFVVSLVKRINYRMVKRLAYKVILTKFPQIYMTQLSGKDANLSLGFLIAFNHRLSIAWT